MENELNNTNISTEEGSSNNTPTEKELIESCFGRNEAGYANSEVSCSLLTYKGTNEEYTKDENYKELSTRFTKQAEFYLEAHFGFVQIDLTFKSALDPELRLFWNQMTLFGTKLASVNNPDNPEEEKPFMAFNIMPDKYLGKYYLSFVNPIMWVLQPQTVGTDKCNVLRMLVPADNFIINEMREDVDLAKLEAEASRTYATIRKEN